MRVAYYLAFCLIFLTGSSAFAGEEEWQKLNIEARDLFQAGKSAEALKVAEKALTYARANLGENHSSVAKSLNNLGVLNYVQRNIKEAKKYYQESLKVSETAFGPNHPYTADTLINIGKLHQMEQQYSESVSSFERALAIREKSFGKEDPQVAAVLALFGADVSANGPFNGSPRRPKTRASHSK